MIFATMMLAATRAAPTIAAVERLPPAAAGELVLAGRAHRPIAAVIRPEARGRTGRLLRPQALAGKLSQSVRRRSG